MEILFSGKTLSGTVTQAAASDDEITHMVRGQFFPLPHCDLKGERIVLAPVPAIVYGKILLNNVIDPATIEPRLFAGRWGEVPVGEVKFPKWIIVQWEYSLKPNNVEKRSGFIFAKFDTEKRTHVVVHPDQRYIEVTENGAILLKAGQRPGTFTAADRFWPEAMVDPVKTAVLLRLSDVLQREDSAPLAALIRSPQPYKKLGLELQKELQRAINLLNELFKIDDPLL